MSEPGVFVLGNELRGDDGVGPAVARWLAPRMSGSVDVSVVSDPIELIGRWDDIGLAVVADAMRSGRPPGTVRVMDPDDDVAAGSGTLTTHTLGLMAALRLSRALGHAPDRVVVVGIEGRRFGPGADLSSEVAAAVPVAGHRILELVKGGVPCA